VSCLTRGRGLKPLAGDDVEWHLEDDGTAVVDAIAERRSTFFRIDAAGRPEAVAANLSQLLVVVAPAPAPDWFLLDRYLAAADLMDIEAAVVWNKADQRAIGGTEADIYRSIGYRVFESSTKSGDGIEELSAAMAGHRSALVGQSGVGKSSLINALIGEPMQAVGELAGRGAHGRHTTTTSVLYRLATGGELLDSPGVRHYAPHIDESTPIDRGFREFVELAARCRFANCKHLAEPGCAIKAALDEGSLAKSRYESYMKLLETLEALRRELREGPN
jgi:ribosome biogenesis GTPase / thiamine phosphate phosphatase